MTCLLQPQMIMLDDYFVDREHTPRDEVGDYDYESIYALDIKQFNADLEPSALPAKRYSAVL